MTWNMFGALLLAGYAGYVIGRIHMAIRRGQCRS